jgi:hypothetical protein
MKRPLRGPPPWAEYPWARPWEQPPTVPGVTLNTTAGLPRCLPSVQSPLGLLSAELHEVLNKGDVKDLDEAFREAEKLRASRAKPLLDVLVELRMLTPERRGRPKIRIADADDLEKLRAAHPGRDCLDLLAAAMRKAKCKLNNKLNDNVYRPLSPRAIKRRVAAAARYLEEKVQKTAS